MTKLAEPTNDRSGQSRFSRRVALAGGAAGFAGLTRIAAQSSTPVATPIGSPAATPQPPFVFFPTPTPEPVYPLAIIEDQRPEWAGTPALGGNLRLFVGGDDLNDFTPTAFRQDFQITVSYLDPLIRVDDVTLEPGPWLAESWSWSLDGLALEIALRSGVTWHDGTPLTAADVQFSLLCYRDDYDSAVSFMLAVVRDIEVTTDTTLTVTFDEPDGTFPYNAGNLPIFSKAQYEAHWARNSVGDRTLGGFDHGNTQPLGTGPWIIEDRSETGVRFRRNDDHFAAVPLAESLTLTVEENAEAQLDAWRSGDVDLFWPFDGSRYEEMRDEVGHLVVADSTVSYFAAFNFGNPTRIDPGWMASPGLREALTRAVDREGYAESIFGGFIDVDRAGIMTQPWAIDPRVRNPRRNLIAARRLLANNGWVDWDGDGVLDSPAGDRGAFVCIVADDADLGLLSILDTLNADFNDLQFELEVQRLSAEDFATRWTSSFDYDLIAISLNQYAAFTEFDLFGSPWSIRKNLAGWNPGGYWNPEVDEAIFTYLQSWKVEDMKAALGTIQRVTNDDPFALWLGFPQQPVLVRPDLSGFQPNKMWQSSNTSSLWHDEEASIVTPIPPPAASTPEPATPEVTPATE
ncbi:MAG: ABC transporter substrate-binding protein [Chloroflexota bacterium]|nr:ABC transporter substrate-binding protein [Chloroflexota bacterium]